MRDKVWGSANSLFKWRFRSRRRRRCLNSLIAVSALYKTRVAMRFPAKIAFGLPYLLIELFYMGLPVVRTDGRTYGHVITKISRMSR